MALVNDALGIGFEVVTRKDQFPCQFEWQNLQAGQYALGIEPSTNHVLGHKAARERGELIWLEHGEERALRHDVSACSTALTTIAATPRSASARIAAQPDEDYPDALRQSSADRGPLLNAGAQCSRRLSIAGKTILYTGAAGGLGTRDDAALPARRREGRRHRQ